MKKAFSLVELVIVVAVLGILAAIIVPQFQSHTTQAKAAAARKNLRTLRVAIELYAAQHNGVPPGYPDGDTSASPALLVFIYQLCWSTNQSGQYSSTPAPGYNLGPYLKTFPKNPFNGAWLVMMLGNNEDFPAEATGDLAYVYKAASKAIRLDWPGVDNDGTRYYDY
jgi:prepilin-type N-terminal cleavage/methylation domain-containing protein